MDEGRKGWLAAFLLAAVALGVFMTLRHGPVKAGGLTPVATRQLAPNMEFEQLDGGRWRLSEHRGQVVLINLWATWCEPCIERFPHMVQLYNRYKNDRVKFVSMSVDDREDKQALETARQFLRRQNATFPNYLMDENISKSFEKLDIEGVPDVFIYDLAGRRRYALNGNDPNRQFTEKDVDDAIASLVAQR